MTWRDLSDDELVARLVQRGVASPRARTWVAQRDTDDAATVIGDLLDDDRRSTDG